MDSNRLSADRSAGQVKFGVSLSLRFVNLSMLTDVNKLSPRSPKQITKILVAHVFVSIHC